MNIVIFGLTISSAWGNGHATLWRGLTKALVQKACRITFFERDTPYYAAHRDFIGAKDVGVVLYSDWDEIESRAQEKLRDADVVMVSSYCPDGAVAAELAGPAYQVRILYDLDTPVTLRSLREGEALSWLGATGFAPYDLVLSFTGGRAVEMLRAHGARRVDTLYGFVDPEVHRPVQRLDRFTCDLSFLGTHAADRQAALHELLIAPSSRLTDRKFLIGGAQYPHDFAWRPNIYFVHHLPPDDHPAFYCSSRLTLNITRGVMRELGWCPSGRLFEAAACGTPIVSDCFDGIDAFYEPGKEILLAESCADVAAAIALSDAELREIALAARARALAEHTAADRADQLLAAVEACRHSDEPPRPHSLADLALEER